MQKTIDFIKEKIGTTTPKIGLILGSGLGDIAEQIDGVKIPYSDIPEFPVSTVHGHAGQLVSGKLCGKDVVAMQGRFHFYEGYPMQTVVFPVRVMKKLGVETLIVTNAAGGVNKEFKPADLMIINDHLNLMGINPLMGKNHDDFGPRFSDMSYGYNNDYIKLAEIKAEELGINIQKGVYAGMTGPSYETPAEIRMLRTLGADAVGMSTVPEVITANHCGIKVLGISCITNMAAGILDQPLDHNEVIEVTNIARERFIKLVTNIIKDI